MDPLQKINYSNAPLLGITGNSKGIQGVSFTPQEWTGGGVIDTASNVPSRAVDKLPKAQKVNYEEYLPGQAGYSRGTSTWSLIG